MKHWYAFTGAYGIDIYLAANYSKALDEKPICTGSDKICAIYAEDNGKGQPKIDHTLLTRDFIRATHSGRDYGIIALNNRFKKKESALQQFINRLLGRVAL